MRDVLLRMCVLYLMSSELDSANTRLVPLYDFRGARTIFYITDWIRLKEEHLGCLEGDAFLGELTL